MHILLVSGPGISLKEPYDSGIEAFIVSFANQLIKEGHSVDVVASEAEADAKFKLVNPFTALGTAKAGLFTRLREKPAFKKLETDSYDVIHYNMFYPHLVEAGFTFNKPCFLTLHSPADKSRIKAYKEFSLRSDITFVAISERVKHQWDKALGMDMPLVNNGINLDLWPTHNTRVDDYLLWSGRINEEKNVAAAIRVAKHMQLPLKIAGRIVDQQYFDDQVKPHLDCRIQYIGHLTQGELSSLARNASAYLATATWQEPFGLAALEMLASGVPVVGFKTAVPPDWNHISILTTRSHHWEDLVGLVKKSDTVSPGACKEFASKLSIQKMTSNYLKLYRDIALEKSNEKRGFIDNPVVKIVSRQPQTLK